MLNGKGREIYAEGDYYEGDFHNDLRDGQGTHHWRHGEWSGDKYEGAWRENKMHGFGVYHHSDGSKWEGRWLDGHMHGRGQFTDKKGKVTVENYNKGVLIH